MEKTMAKDEPTPKSAPATKPTVMTKAQRLAKALLDAKNLPILEHVLETHLKEAVGRTDMARLKELYEIVAIVDDVKAEIAKVA